MKVYIGSDHAGFELKEKIKEYLQGLALYEVVDEGAFSFKPDDDYPDFIEKVAKAVAIGEGPELEERRGIVLGGSGEGEAMNANRFKGVRACEFYGGNFDIIKVSREHNDANVLSIGARFVFEDEAKFAIELFLNTKFSGDERHIRRINKF